MSRYLNWWTPTCSRTVREHVAHLWEKVSHNQTDTSILPYQLQYYFETESNSNIIFETNWHLFYDLFYLYSLQGVNINHPEQLQNFRPHGNMPNMGVTQTRKPVLYYLQLHKITFCLDFIWPYTTVIIFIDRQFLW